MIENPDFCDDAKLYILDNIRKLSFANSREKVLKAIDAREKQRNAAAKATPQAG